MATDTPRRTELDDAWAEAETAAQELGPDWHLHGVHRDVSRDRDGYHGWRATANDGKYLEQSRNAESPVAALEALAARLRDSQP